MPRNTIPLGTKFTRLLVIGYGPIKIEPSGDRRCTCILHCDCGSIVTVTEKALKSCKTKSCGCLQIESITKRNLIHGNSARHNISKTYSTWCGMIARCYQKGHKDYHSYGGRGIKVCDRWRSFSLFLEDMGERPTNMTIERLDNNGDYQQSNCEWSDLKSQARNKRTNRNVTVMGFTACISEHCEIHGIHVQTVLKRLKLGWPVESAFLIKPRTKLPFRNPNSTS